MSSSAINRRWRWPLLVVGLAAVLAGCKTAPETRPEAAPKEEIKWLEQNSMLYQGRHQADRLTGSGDQWRNSFGRPESKEAVKTTSVWLLYYPGAVIPRPGASVIGTWADPQFWDTMRNVGVDLLHTNPVKRAGGIRDGQFTPTIDGWFDRISLEIDPQLGTEEEYRQMIKVSGERGALIADDLVPLHTGLGADFWLATRNYGEYPGVFRIVEIRQEDWGLLPRVTDPWGTQLVSREAAVQLDQKGYIPGLINSADAHPDAKKWSGWSATAEITGVDGKRRRWVYLHQFKPAQPALNWSDPSYGGRRVTAGDAVRTIYDLGAKVVRLDAVPFLGLEPKPNDVMTEYYMHPLSINGTNDIAFQVRLLGGWSFQELNVPREILKEFTRNGPDLSYDFFTRAQVLHPLITGDTRPLRLAHRQLLQSNIPHGSLIHDLQNHDEITFQLVDVDRDETLDLDGESITGKQLKQRILEEMRTGASGKAAPYNKLYRPEKDGVATTFAGFIAPALGIDPYKASADQIREIQRGHLLVAQANAMQPGVFAISAWDLVGALPIPEETVADRTADGDYRWVNRGGVDVMGANPQADRSAFGLPRAKALYGPVPEQLKSPDSFASQLKKMLDVRKQHRIAEGDMLAIPNIPDRGVCVLIMKLPDSQDVAITALNYKRGPASVEVDLSNLPGISADQLRGRRAHDIIAGQDVGNVSDTHRLKLELDRLSGRTIVLRR